MAKYKYATEYEINASVKMLYPYLSTPGGLKEWFADNVEVSEDGKVFDIIWDNESHLARIATKRTNSHIKFLFEPRNEEDVQDQAFLEFRMDFNDMTQTSFLRITDYSDMDNDEELQDLWDRLVEQLRERVGGQID
jgi:uncharacterized protein YndB with AHSA1/START domain